MVFLSSFRGRCVSSPAQSFVGMDGTPKETVGRVVRLSNHFSLPGDFERLHTLDFFCRRLEGGWKSIDIYVHICVYMLRAA